MKRSITFNKFFNIVIIAGILLLLSVVLTLDGEDRGIGIALIVVAIILLAAALFVCPCFYSFDSDGVSIHYVFYSQERYLWKNISSIRQITDSASCSHPFFDLLFSRAYEIKGKVEGKKRFYMQGHVSKSFRARKLIEKYWDGEITKEFEFSSKKSKAQKKKHISADEANEQERSVRLKMRKWQEPLKAKAERAGLEFRSKYIYVTEDLYEYPSRPNQAYTYTYEAEICKSGEKDENKIAYFSVELLDVRVGKESLKWVENSDIDSELDNIAEEINNIITNGIDKYFE